MYVCLYVGTTNPGPRQCVQNVLTEMKKEKEKQLFQQKKRRKFVHTHTHERKLENVFEYMYKQRIIL